MKILVKTNYGVDFLADSVMFTPEDEIIIRWGDGMPVNEWLIDTREFVEAFPDLMNER